MSGFAYLIFVVGTLLAWAFGAVGAYFYFRTHHREAIADLDALSRELDEREEELHRLQYQFTKANPESPSGAQFAKLKKTQEELEQKRNDYNILKQDFDLEIGILKQELEQLKSGESDVEHTRRRIVRKSSELKERESLLIEKEKDVNERAKNLDADIAARKQHLEDQIAARKQHLEDQLAGRLKRVEDGLRERDEELRTRFDVLESERAALERERASLRKKQEQLDKELLELPVHRFTSSQEALLIKRLRQQIKLQRDELEQLQHRVHRATTERLTGSTTAQRDTYDPDQEAVAQHGAGRDEKAALAGATRRTDDDANVQSALVQRSGNDAPDSDDSFPTYTTLSSYVQQERSASKEESRAAAEPVPGDPHEPTADAALPNGANGFRHDDLTSLPGVDSQLQDRLYRLGITSFDQIVRWSSSDVGVVSDKLNVDRKTIQDHWIINAQSHLFSRKDD